MGDLESTLKNLLHSRSGSQLASQLSITARRMGVSAAPMQIGEDRYPHVGAGQPRRGLKTVEHGESFSRSLQLCNCYGAIQFVDCGRCDPLQECVTLDHFVPASLLKRRGKAMFRCDRRLGMVPGKDIAGSGLGQPREADLDFPLIPEVSVLLLEQEQPACSVLASSQPSRMQMH